MKAQDLITGTKIEFTPTGKIFEIGKVTEKRISWHLDFTCKGGYGKNNLRMTSTSIKIFQKGIDSGTYRIITL